MKFKSLVLVLVTVIWIALILSVHGCAVPNTVRGDLAVAGPTLLLTGPAKGHLATSSDRPVTVHIVNGSNCEDTVEGVLNQKFANHTTFDLITGFSLCVTSYRPNERVLFHAERP